MPRTNTLIIGAGQAGLATSRCLTTLDIDHVVLERGSVADRWRTARWDSLRLLSPNWQTSLPGWTYRGDDPSGFMTMPEIIDHLRSYALSFEAPVLTDTVVSGVHQAADGYLVETAAGNWLATNVVVATGYADVPRIPATAATVADDILQLTPTQYHNPAQIPDGGVLVVGASASGVQLADEVARCGRSITIAAGRHIRMRRRYRGADIMWWLDRLGHFDTILDPDRSDDAGGLNSLQLIGTPEGRNLDLATLQARGVRVCGRLLGVHGTTARLADDLCLTTAEADARLGALLMRIDTIAAATSASSHPPDRRPIDPVDCGGATSELDLRAEGIRTIIWATGFRRDYSWLRVPLLSAAGEIEQRFGITKAPGLYTVGMRHQRTRHSSSIGGVGRDAKFVADHILRRSLDHPIAAAGVAP